VLPPFDVTDDAVRESMDELGDIDILVNNVGHRGAFRCAPVHRPGGRNGDPSQFGGEILLQRLPTLLCSAQELVVRLSDRTLDQTPLLARSAVSGGHRSSADRC